MVRHSRCDPAEKGAHIWREQDVLWQGPAFHIRKGGGASPGSLCTNVTAMVALAKAETNLPAP